MSAPLLVPPIAIVSSPVLIKPASAAMHAISQVTFTPWPKRRRVAETIPSVWRVLNLFLTARPRVPKAWAVVRIFALLFWMTVRFCGLSCCVLGLVNPVTWVTTVRLKFLKIWEALAPASPVVVATIMFVIPRASARFFARFRVCSVFFGPGFSKYTVFVIVSGTFFCSNQFWSVVNCRWAGFISVTKWESLFSGGSCQIYKCCKRFLSKVGAMVTSFTVFLFENL